MRKIYGLALVVVVLMGAGLFYFWTFYGVQVKGVDVSPFAGLDQMENVGVPLFSGEGMNGEKVSLTFEPGQKVILNFWASWCEPCIQEFPSMIRLIKESKGRVKLVAVSGDSSKADVENFLKSFPEVKDPLISVVWDQDGAIRKIYGVEKLPESYVIGADGKLLRKIVGTIDWATPDSFKFFE